MKIYTLYVYECTQIAICLVRLKMLEGSLRMVYLLISVSHVDPTKTSAGEIISYKLLVSEIQVNILNNIQYNTM